MAADACVVSGMGGTYIEMAGALAMAQAQGVNPAIAASYIAACSSGLANGRAEKQARETATDPAEGA